MRLFCTSKYPAKRREREVERPRHKGGERGRDRHRERERGKARKRGECGKEGGTGGRERNSAAGHLIVIVPPRSYGGEHSPCFLFLLFSPPLSFLAPRFISGIIVENAVDIRL